MSSAIMALFGSFIGDYISYFVKDSGIYAGSKSAVLEREQKPGGGGGFNLYARN